MGVEFVNITVSTSGLYQTSTRDFGTVAIVGDGGTLKTDPVKVGSYTEAADQFGTTALGVGVKNALRNGATCVWAVDCGAPTLISVATALASLEGYDVQVVALADMVETVENTYISTALANHLDSASTERIGVFQLDKAQDAATMPTAIAGLLTGNKSRLFGVAHNSDSDVACAVAGLIAGLKPQESPLLKPITNVIQTVGFTNAQISALEAAHINCLANPVYLTGTSFVLKSDFTLGTDSSGINYIDTRRVIDDITYKMKAGLTSPNIIGNVRINKSGLAVVLGRLSGILQLCVNSNEIDDYALNFPILNALAKPKESRSPAELELISSAGTSRAISGEAAITYMGVLHFINIDVKISV